MERLSSAEGRGEALMKARAISCVILCCFLLHSGEVLGNDQPIDPGTPGGAAGSKPPVEERKQDAPSKKKYKKLRKSKKRSQIDPGKAGGPAKRPETPEK